jgi:single-strand DNA-binding protein
LSYLPSQTPVVEFGLATNRKWKSNDGQMREEVCFVDCRAYGRMAENISKYCQKGRPLMIEGRLTFDQWEAQDGSKRSKHRVTVESFNFVDSGGGGRSNNDDATPAPAGANEAPANDDIPF